MDSMLKGLFGGGDDDRSPQARDFINRYEQGPIDQGYSDDEAVEHYQRVAQHADPETMQRAAEQAFARMDPGQRAQLAQQLQQQTGGQGPGVSDDPRQMAGLVSQMQRQQPGGLASLLGGGGSRSGGGESRSGGGGLADMVGGALGGGGGGGFPGGTLGKVALGGIAAYAMKEMLGGDDDGKRRKRSV